LTSKTKNVYKKKLKKTKHSIEILAIWHQRFRFFTNILILVKNRNLWIFHQYFNIGEKSKSLVPHAEKKKQGMSGMITSGDFNLMKQ